MVVPLLLSHNQTLSDDQGQVANHNGHESGLFPSLNPMRLQLSYLEYYLPQLLHTICTFLYYCNPSDALFSLGAAGPSLIGSVEC